MKNIKVSFGVILIFIVLVLGFISMREFNKSPEESGKIYLDVIFKGDKSNIEKVGINGEDYAALKKNKEDILMAQLQISPLACVLIDSEKYNHAFLNNITSGLSKLEYDVIPVSISNNAAKVNVKINYFELSKIMKEGQEKMSGKIKDNPYMNRTEMITETYKTVEEEFNKGPSEGNKATITVNLVKKNNLWIPDDDFESEVCKIILR